MNIVKKYLNIQDSFIPRTIGYYTNNYDSQITFVWVHGFIGSAEGEKFESIAMLAEALQCSFLAPDVSGHGISSPDYYQDMEDQSHAQNMIHIKDGSIGMWRSEISFLLDSLCQNKTVIMCGTSMGAWLSLMACQDKPHIVKSSVMIASSPDFPLRLIKKYTPEQQEYIMKGQPVPLVQIPSSYFKNTDHSLTREFVEESKKHTILDKSTFDINQPISIIHGTCDDVIPYEYPMKLINIVTSQSITFTLVKNGDHNLKRPEDIEIILAHLQDHFTKASLSLLDEEDKK